MSISRLSDQNIQDPIMRAHYHRRVIEHIDSGSDLKAYTIKPDEEFRYDLASRRAFGTIDLDWLLALAAGNQDTSSPLPVGETLNIPTSGWIRQSMRDFIDEMRL